jgi:hypothetical protein
MTAAVAYSALHPSIAFENDTDKNFPSGHPSCLRNIIISFLEVIDEVFSITTSLLAICCKSCTRTDTEPLYADVSLPCKLHFESMILKDWYVT